MAHSVAFTGLQGHSVGAFYPVRVVGVGDLWRVKDAANVTVWNTLDCNTAHVIAQLLHDTANSYASDAQHGYRLYCHAVDVGLIRPVKLGKHVKYKRAAYAKNRVLFDFWIEGDLQPDSIRAFLAQRTDLVNFDPIGDIGDIWATFTLECTAATAAAVYKAIR